MLTFEAKEFQLVYQAEVMGDRTAVIHTGIVLCQRLVCKTSEDFRVMMLDPIALLSNCPPIFQDILAWFLTKEEAINRATSEVKHQQKKENTRWIKTQASLCDERNEEIHKRNGEIDALNDLRNLVRA
jgi:hypothetical protein